MKEWRTDGKCRDGGVVGRRSKVYDQRGMDPRWKAELIDRWRNIGMDRDDGDIKREMGVRTQDEREEEFRDEMMD